MVRDNREAHYERRAGLAQKEVCGYSERGVRQIPHVELENADQGDRGSSGFLRGQKAG
jgi:hypothetical protein